MKRTRSAIPERDGRLDRCAVIVGVGAGDHEPRAPATAASANAHEQVEALLRVKPAEEQHDRTVARPRHPRAELPPAAGRGTRRGRSPAARRSIPPRPSAPPRRGSAPAVKCRAAADESSGGRATRGRALLPRLRARLHGSSMPCGVTTYGTPARRAPARQVLISSHTPWTCTTSARDGVRHRARPSPRVEAERAGRRPDRRHLDARRAEPLDHRSSSSPARTSPGRRRRAPRALRGRAIPASAETGPPYVGARVAATWSTRIGGVMRSGGSGDARRAV